MKINLPNLKKSKTTKLVIPTKNNKSNKSKNTKEKINIPVIQPVQNELINPINLMDDDYEDLANETFDISNNNNEITSNNIQSMNIKLPKIKKPKKKIKNPIKKMPIKLPDILKPPINIDKASKATGNVISGAGKGIGNIFEGISKSLTTPIIIIGVVVVAATVMSKK